MKLRFLSTPLVPLLFFTGVAQTTQQQLINLKFGGNNSLLKTGPAAVGVAPDDYWNRYSRDGSHGQYLEFGVAANLKWADGTAAAVGALVENAPGLWGNGHGDPMFMDYLYPFNGRSITVTVTNLPPGVYSVYAYGHGGPPDVQNTRFSVQSAGVDYGSQRTTTRPGWLSTRWEVGVQYAWFTNVSVHPGYPLVVISSPDAIPQAILNGLQLVREAVTPNTPFPTIPPPPLPGGETIILPPLPPVPRPDVTGAIRVPAGTNDQPGVLLNIQFGVDASPVRVGPAGLGQVATDFWNLYSRDNGQGGYRHNGGLTNLFWANGQPAPASLLLANAPGAWGNGFPDPMISTYLYPLGTNAEIQLTLKDLPTGTYDVAVFAHGGPPDAQNSQVELFSVGDSWGTAATASGPEWHLPELRPGRQFVLFTNVPVVSGQPLIVYSRPDATPGVSTINGVQLLQTSTSVILPAPEISISPGGTGIFTNSVVVTLGGHRAGAEVRLTTDGSEPTVSSALYVRPFELRTSSLVQARAFRDGVAVGALAAQKFARAYEFNDGITAEWRTRYFGANFWLDARALPAADPDSDGSTNAQEFANHTDPLDPLSGFLTSVRLVPAITWRSEPGKAYEILRKEQAEDPEWILVREIVADGPFSRFVDADVANANSFYIVRPKP